jgi:tetratricopeptide (TPR) repeat protein
MTPSLLPPQTGSRRPAHRRPEWTVLFGLLAAILSAPGGTHVPAEDRVTILPEFASKPIVEIGDVTEFNSRRIVIRVQSGNPIRTHPAKAVQHIETHYTSQHERGLSAFEAGDTLAAEREFEQALQQEPRGWVQEELRAWLVRCAIRRGDRAAAGSQFARILEHDVDTRHWGVAPLVWAPETVGDALRSDARNWLTSRVEGVRLLGASVLLVDANFGTAARTEIDRLGKSLDATVQSLARAQSWRLKLIEGEPSAFELSLWRQRIDAMPSALRAGPTYLLGRAAALASDSEQAAADWLWLPLVYHEDEHLAARACLEAADALSRLGRATEAETLYREVVERYGWSPFADEARQKLAATTTP